MHNKTTVRDNSVFNSFTLQIPVCQIKWSFIQLIFYTLTILRAVKVHQCWVVNCRSDKVRPHQRPHFRPRQFVLRRLGVYMYTKQEVMVGLTSRNVQGRHAF
jgi:hypothetical protein